MCVYILCVHDQGKKKGGGYHDGGSIFIANLSGPADIR